jgi:hypothetical protein
MEYTLYCCNNNYLNKKFVYMGNFLMFHAFVNITRNFIIIRYAGNETLISNKLLINVHTTEEWANMAKELLKSHKIIDIDKIENIYKQNKMKILNIWNEQQNTWQSFNTINPLIIKYLY